MNDPHVIALIYQVRHDASTDYSRAGRLERDEPGFRLTVEGGKVRFELKDHFPTAELAKQATAIDGYIRAWEFDTALTTGSPDGFRLEFLEAEIVDRDPTPGEITPREFAVRVAFGSPKIVSVAGRYPSPPSDLVLNPDAERMHLRYMRYLRDRELLPSLAYFCLTMLEGTPAPPRARRSGKRPRRAAAAEKFNIEQRVLDRIGELSSTAGGPEARKREAVDRALSQEERDFLHQAVRAIIRRVAEAGHPANANLPTISLSDFLSTANRRQDS